VCPGVVRSGTKIGLPRADMEARGVREY
jgi:hypothetical protein